MEFVCNKPYIQVGSECCLDKNGDKVCDKDEQTDIKETEAKKSINPNPVQALTVEYCTGTYYFDCPWSYITKDEVQFKLRATRSGIAIIKRIEIPNVPCTKEFGNIPLEKGMKYDEIRQFNVTCNFKKNSVDSDVKLYITQYPIEGFKEGDTSKEWMGYKEPIEMVTILYISGMVR